LGSSRGTEFGRGRRPYVAEESGLLPTEEFLHDALAAGYTIDDVLMAEDQLLAVDVSSPEVCSVPVGTKGTRLASRVVQGVARRQMAGKPWRGPPAGKDDISTGHTWARPGQGGYSEEGAAR
jgi:hypothetical protein